MDMTGQYRIAAPREAVWRALNDPAVLGQCIPGCESIERTAANEFTARVVAKVGPVKAGFGGKVTLSDLDPPNGYTISGEGQGGAAGFAKGEAKVKLTDDGPGTLLNYEVHASVGGKLAQIGSRLIDGTARKMAEDFFARFAELVAAEPGVSGLAAPAPTEPATTAPAEAPAPTPAPAAAPARAGLRPTVWIPLLVAVVLIILLIFGWR
jgi:uncharacterized protein